jgi:hypothetical protein
VREHESAGDVPRRVEEHELRAAAVGQVALPGGEEAQLDELDVVVALPAGEHLVERDTLGGNRRPRDADDGQRERYGMQVKLSAACERT